MGRLTVYGPDETPVGFTVTHYEDLLDAIQQLIATSERTPEQLAEQAGVPLEFVQVVASGEISDTESEAAVVSEDVDDIAVARDHAAGLLDQRNLHLAKLVAILPGQINISYVPIVEVIHGRPA